MYDKIKMWWERIQDLLSLDGGLYIDCMCIVIIIRLLAVLWNFPPMTVSESGLWAATISAFAASKFNGPRGS